MTPFLAKDCALSVIATGEVATSLIQLKDLLYKVPISAIYHHFWGGRLSYHLTHPEFHNDFSRWVRLCIHDEILFERLAIIDPTDYPNLEDLRKCIIEIIENRLVEIDFLFSSRGENIPNQFEKLFGYNFHFLRSIILVFNLPIAAKHPSELKNIISNLPTSSIFYHFIDARRRTPVGFDDFSFWLMAYKEEFSTLITKIRSIDPFFLSLTEIRHKLTEVFNEQFS